MSDFRPNPGQARAIDAPVGSPVRVVAGAGTGKTEVIARRFAHLLAEDRTLRPEQILVLTFSEKAAAEMRARIFRTVTLAGLGIHRLDLAAASISTFHSFCARLLADHTLWAGIDSDRPLLSEIETRAVLDELEETFLEEGFRQAYGTFDPLSVNVYPWEDAAPFEPAMAILAQLRNQAVGPDEFRRQAAAVANPTDRHQVLAPLVGWLYQAYLDRLNAAGLLDFDRLITGAVALVESNGDVRRDLHNRFRALLVDEYQDTNFAQERLLRALAADGLTNVTVVGDPRQAIYVWREARVQNIANFPGRDSEFDIPLTENRRSLAPILGVANQAIAGYEFDDPPEFPPDAELAPYGENAQFSDNVVSLQAAATREEEAAQIVSWILQTVPEPDKLRDIAVLIRARTYLATYLDAFDKAGIPYELSADNAFYIRSEILDAIHLLNVCLNPADELSLARTLLSPAVGLSQSQVALLRRARDGGLWRAVADAHTAEVDNEVAMRLSRFHDFWQDAQRQRWLLPPGAFVGWVIRRSGLQATGEPTAQRALRKLLAVAQTYEADHAAAPLPDLVEYLRLLLDGNLREKAPEINTESQAVRVMTAHASKGLEFPVVIAVDCRQKVKPAQTKQPFHEPEGGLVFPEDEEAHPKVVDRMRRTRNEARCLWYVTLTRAKKRLIITSTNDKSPDVGPYAKVTTFFEELWNGQLNNHTPGVASEVPTVEVVGNLPGQTASSGETDLLDAARQLRSQLSSRLGADRLEVHISPTTFLRWRQCPAAYRYDSLWGLGRINDDLATGGSGGEADKPTLLGTAFHQAVAAHARQAQASVDSLLDALPSDVRENLASAHEQTLRTWLESYLASDLGRTPPGPGEVERTLLLNLDFANVRLVLSGIADRLAKGRLVEYKTDAEPKSLIERYGDQLRLYALAARRAGLLLTDATLTIYHAPTATQSTVPFAAGDEARLMYELQNLATTATQSNADFQPRPGPYCRWCAARETVCGVGQRWLQ